MPLIALDFALAGGAAQDPAGKAGAATMLAGLLILLPTDDRRITIRRSAIFGIGTNLVKLFVVVLTTATDNGV